MSQACSVLNVSAIIVEFVLRIAIGFCHYSRCERINLDVLSVPSGCDGFISDTADQIADNFDGGTGRENSFSMLTCKCSSSA